jgi:hypothetical protein
LSSASQNFAAPSHQPYLNRFPLALVSHPPVSTMHAPKCLSAQIIQRAMPTDVTEMEFFMFDLRLVKLRSKKIDIYFGTKD